MEILKLLILLVCIPFVIIVRVFRLIFWLIHRTISVACRMSGGEGFEAAWEEADNDWKSMGQGSEMGEM